MTGCVTAQDSSATRDRRANRQWHLLRMTRVHSTHSANIARLRLAVDNASETVSNTTLLLHDDEQDAVTDVGVRRECQCQDLSLVTASCMSVCLAPAVLTV